MQFDGVEHSPKLGGVISLFTMQQSLLRASLSVMNCSDVDPSSIGINERDSVYPLRVESSSSNLLNFAISENTTASPNIRIYTRENLKDEIRANAFEFVHRTVRFYFQGDVLKVRAKYRLHVPLIAHVRALHSYAVARWFSLPYSVITGATSVAMF